MAQQSRHVEKQISNNGNNIELTEPIKMYRRCVFTTHPLRPAGVTETDP